MDAAEVLAPPSAGSTGPLKKLLMVETGDVISPLAEAEALAFPLGRLGALAVFPVSEKLSAGGRSASALGLAEFGAVEAGICEPKYRRELGNRLPGVSTMVVAAEAAGEPCIVGG